MKQPARHFLASIFIVQLLAACAGHKNMSFADSRLQRQTQSIFAVTNRAAADNGDIFNGGRGGQLSFDPYAISIPPSHKPGKVEWAKGKPTRKSICHRWPRLLFRRGGVQGGGQQRGGGQACGEREAMVFIHGYNTSYSESIYRLAQIKHDFNIRASPSAIRGPPRPRRNIMSMTGTVSRSPATGCRACWKTWPTRM